MRQDSTPGTVQVGDTRSITEHSADGQYDRSTPACLKELIGRKSVPVLFSIEFSLIKNQLC